MKPVKFLSCFLVGFSFLLILLIIGFCVGIYFYKCQNVKDMNVWVAYVGGYLGTSLALVGSIVLGYIAIKQSKQAQCVNDLLFAKENTCMIEFDAYYGGGYRDCFNGLFIACSKLDITTMIISDLCETAFNDKVHRMTNNPIKCLVFEFYFKETLSPIKTFRINSVAFNKAFAVDEINSKYYKKLNIMPWNKGVAICSYFPEKKLRKIDMTIDIQDPAYLTMLNNDGQLTLDFNIDLVSYFEKTTNIDLTINLNGIKEVIRYKNGKTKTTIVDILEFNSNENENTKAPYLICNYDIENIKS